jgi:hypothetical protein
MRRCSSQAALPAHADFADVLAFFAIESPMWAAVNDQGWGIFFVQYSHHAVQELIIISVKFYNVIKVLVRIDYFNIRV